MELKEKPVYTSTHDVDLSQLDIDALNHCHTLFSDLADNSVEITLDNKFRSLTYHKDDWELVLNRIDALMSTTK